MNDVNELVGGDNVGPEKKKPKKSSKGCILLALGCLVLPLVLCCVVGGTTYIRFTQAVREGIAEGRKAVKNSSMNQQQKDGLVAQIDRVEKAFDDGEFYSTETWKKLAVAISRGQRGLLIGIFSTYSTGLERHRLEGVELANASLHFKRCSAGLMNRQIDSTEAENILGKYMRRDPNGMYQPRPGGLSKEEFTEFVDAMKKLADAAEIPNDAEADYAGALKEFLDDILGE